MRRHLRRQQTRPDPWMLESDSRSSDRIGEKNMADVKFVRDITAVLVIDPYNDFISEGGKFWPRLKAVAEANNCVPNMLQILNAVRAAELRVFYALHRRYRPGDYA